jgi:small subunit ribosomal protein S20
MGKEEKKQKLKRPTALKRDIRNEKHRIINKSFKSNARTTMRSFEEALKAQDKVRIQDALNTLYSVMDLGIKRGIYKPNKAARVKARATQKALPK